MKRYFLPLIAIACLSLPVYAVAGHHADGKACSKDKHHGKSGAHVGHHGCGKHHDLTKFDTNKDKKISFEEFSAGYMEGLKKRFKHYDTDGDGFLTDADKKPTGKKCSKDSSDKADPYHGGTLSDHGVCSPE